MNLPARQFEESGDVYRVAPQNLEAEQALLGAMLINMTRSIASPISSSPATSANRSTAASTKSPRRSSAPARRRRRSPSRPSSPAISRSPTSTRRNISPGLPPRRRRSSTPPITAAPSTTSPFAVRSSSSARDMVNIAYDAPGRHGTESADRRRRAPPLRARREWPFRGRLRQFRDRPHPRHRHGERRL